MNSEQHQRYKIEICKGDEVIQKLGIPLTHTRFHVVEIARKELKRVSTATHASIRDAEGTVVEIFPSDSWATIQMQAFRLK